MLTLNQIFLRNTTFLIIFSLISLMIGSYVTVRSDNIDHYKNLLQQQIILIETPLTQTNDFQYFANNIHNKIHNRVTIINEQGIVLADSNENHLKMENHYLRPEIMHSNTKAFGADVRFSHTLNKEFLYVARKVHTPHGNVYIRLATELTTIIHDIYNVWVKIAVGLSLVFFLLLFMSWRLGRQIKQEILSINDFLYHVEQKNYTAPLASGFAAEFVQLAKSLIKLSRRLGKREKSKAKYVEKLKQKNQQISDVIDAISHEFKNPVAAIMGYAQTVRDDPEMNPKLHARFLTKIYDNGQVISDLIDRLALSLRFENDTVTLSKTSFNLVDVLTQAAENLEQKFQNRHVVITAPPVINVIADRSMIFQIITNLVDNALKYSKENVNIICHCTPKSVKISVADKGVGIDQEHIEHITKKFYRIDRYSWDNSLGIGLALVEYMIKLHGSHIEIGSQIGVGSTFSFSLHQADDL